MADREYCDFFTLSSLSGNNDDVGTCNFQPRQGGPDASSRLLGLAGAKNCIREKATTINRFIVGYPDYRQSEGG